MISGCAAIIIILFLYCIAVATNYFDKLAIEGTAGRFVFPAFVQQQEEEQET